MRAAPCKQKTGGVESTSTADCGLKAKNAKKDESSSRPVLKVDLEVVVGEYATLRNISQPKEGDTVGARYGKMQTWIFIINF